MYKIFRFSMIFILACLLIGMVIYLQGYSIHADASSRIMLVPIETQMRALTRLGTSGWQKPFSFPLILETQPAITVGYLAWPIDCVPGETCASFYTGYIGYPDMNLDGVAFDCSSSNYAGSESIDFMITWQQMDAGVTVFAAADGLVTYVVDDKYDRCPDPHPDCINSQGNYIDIQHELVPGVIMTEYYHLKQYSALVSVGDFVIKGQPIAQAGSSGVGARTLPHLDLEIYGPGYVPVDPWAGPCGTSENPLWENDPPWGGSSRLTTSPQAAGNSAKLKQALDLSSISSTTPLVFQEPSAKLTAGDGGTQDFFGVPVSIEGDTAVVAAQEATIGGNIQQGAAYVFYRNQGGAGAWGHVAKLTAADGASDDLFGRVAVSGDTIIVGAFGANIAENHKQGAAYVFYRDQGGPDVWGQVAKLTASDGMTSDWFGSSVSIDGDTAIIGARGAESGIYGGEGAAYIFYRDEGGQDAWGQVAKLTASDDIMLASFGSSVSLSGDTAIVGAHNDLWAFGGIGAAYIFERNQGGVDAWGQVAKLTPSKPEGYLFGLSVAVDGDTVIVGAPFATAGGQVEQGTAYIYYRDWGGPGAWGQVAQLAANDAAWGDGFGAAAISGDRAIVGALFADVNGNRDQGAAYIFERNQGGMDAWGQVLKLAAGDGAPTDGSWGSVAMDGTSAILGAPLADVGGILSAGAAYVYEIQETYSISGRVIDATDSPIPGVTIMASGGYTATTDSSGTYTFTYMTSGTYVLTPTLEGYSFDPLTHSVELPPDATDQDFLGTMVTYSISGQVVDGYGQPLAGVTIWVTGGYSVTTDASGTYTLLNQLPGSYVLSPELDGYSFDPVTRSVALPPDAINQDFVGTLISFRMFIPIVLQR